MTILTTAHFEYVLSIANVLVLAIGVFLCYTVVSELKKGLERDMYNLLFMVMFLLMAGQLLNVLDRFQVVVIPGGSAILYLAISATLLYKLLIRQTRWKIE